MKNMLAIAALAVQAVQAYPSMVESTIRSMAEREVARVAKRQTPISTPPFDAKLQYVSTTGKHAFKAPSGTDQRGPCPGLNAMANHGYFPHNGVGGMVDFVKGCGDSFGMGPDLAEFLAVYGAVLDGNLLEYSIGGPYPTLTNLGGLLGEPYGLSGSHNKYEGDVSPVRGDLYQYGNDYENQVKQFCELYELGMQNGGLIDLNVLTSYRSTRFDQSVAENPYFFNAPFSGVIASPAAWSFIYRFMANHTSEHPQGYLDLETLKLFYSMTGDYPDFKYTPGYEKFPDNWYKRHPIDDYTIPYLALDAVEAILEHPKLASLGGNTGTVNSFVGVEPEDLTGGIFNAPSLLQGNNLFCYGLELTIQEIPDILSGLFTDINSAMDKIGPIFNKASDSLGCPKLNSINRGQFDKFPGFTELQADGTYKKH